MSDTTDKRQRAHALIGRLSDAQLSALVGLLEGFVDPVAAALRSAPIDDEPEADGEKQAVAEARAWLAQRGGKGISHEEAMGGCALRRDRCLKPPREWPSQWMQE